MFKQILTHDEKEHLADNAQYWLVECAYAVEDYTGSLEAFKRVFQFHETEKDDDAQLKLNTPKTRMNSWSPRRTSPAGRGRA